VGETLDEDLVVIINALGFSEKCHTFLGDFDETSTS
jgi:hypothetical protein